MIDTSEYYGGTYPSPDEIEEEQKNESDYESYLEMINDDIRIGE